MTLDRPQLGRPCRRASERSGTALSHRRRFVVGSRQGGAEGPHRLRLTAYLIVLIDGVPAHGNNDNDNDRLAERAARRAIGILFGSLFALHGPIVDPANGCGARTVLAGGLVGPPCRVLARTASCARRRISGRNGCANGELRKLFDLLVVQAGSHAKSQVKRTARMPQEPLKPRRRYRSAGYTAH
jgi:hypothetical protein